MIEINLARTLSGADGTIGLTLEATLKPGELVTLYGPSGSGKTSVLRMLAGLMKPDNGYITIDKLPWYHHAHNVFVKPQYRSIGMVFQEYSLFPNMTVRENLAYALGKNQEENVIDDLLEIIELKNLAHKKPSLLSGGQKQRVALARALVRKPRLLLLDEPLSALDSAMRARLQDYILEIHRQFHLTTLLVSHDLPEIIKMSERTWLLENGRMTEIEPKSLIP